MADNAQQAAQFVFWNDHTANAIIEMDAALKAEPVVIEQLADALDGLLLDLQQLESFKPTAKKVSYEYATAFPNIALAQRLVLRAQRKLGIQPVALPPQEPQVLPNALFSQRKIPEIPLGTFTGKFSEYQAFIRVFHLKYDKLDIPPAEKLVQLQRAVSGPPDQIIGRLQPVDDNYEIAVQALELQYAHPNRVKSELHSEILHMKPACDSTVSLQSTYFELEGLLSSLQSHGEDINDNPPLRDRIA